ncbi:MAG: patatin-like phospholipase family protein, partial [Gemmatimonadetes bacterium]|nr:patatin-like phospholipase family protein [Gemmatimonadota bacterium]NIS01403.1 patatin-like phospholipase family protein [Gemmatimonadota bacterium]NIT68628.1 patatin-like phospholipase family protein [Gemmatimonadota bacterium]NIU53195.1 patatin-like phospholipase family protein [Gemmatimonadota bacterium]NIW77353.1 patatin-like phospholipase family protein [Gemmatimonadota bacterium]
MNGLVLSGGGARAAYQVGVISYIAEVAPQVTFPIIVGVSAG